MNVSPILRFALVGAVISSSVRADVKLPAILSDHMVLRRTAKVPVWGNAAPDEDVTVSLNGQTAKAEADAAGKWMTFLNLEDSAPGPFEMTVTGTNKLTLSDVVVGEIWLASGQSNMAMTVGATTDAAREIAGSANPMLRQFTVPRNATTKPQDDTRGSWVTASPKTTGSFSAAGYFFIRKLHGELKVPVGLVNSSWSGTAIEGWISMEGTDSVPDLKRLRERNYASIDGYPAQKNPPAPEKVGGCLFNGMINPLRPCAISGVIWYQGEANARNASQYRTTFPLLIADWRKQWNQGDFPFYFCQLANHMGKRSMPGDSNWAELREAQSMALKVPNTGQAVLIDIGEANDIHPRDKKDAGERLARLALANDYGKAIPSSGPVYDSMKIGNSRAILSFKHADAGLVARPLPDTYIVKSSAKETAPLVRNSPGSELEGFAICGEDKEWVWADARIDGATVVVWSDKVPAPVAVRYAWADNPTCNLFNGAGLPASPFRTDDFAPATLDPKK